MRPDLPTGTVTFLFTDIEGSTLLLRRLGPELYAEALAAHRQTLRDAFAAEGGVEIDTQGDAFFVAFPTAGGTAAALLEDEPLRDLGLHRLKDFDAPARLFQLGVADFPPLRTAGAVDLPIPATRFLGREHELFEATSSSPSLTRSRSRISDIASGRT
jgi:class 3 adenylate cyclase